MAFHERVQEIGEKGFHLSELILADTLKEIDTTAGPESSHLMYGAIMHGAGAIKFIASLIAKGQGPEKAHNANKETMLAAGLIMARCVQPTPDGISLDFSPRNVLASIIAANKIAGEDDFERHFDQDMLDCYKEGTRNKELTYDGYWDYLDGVTPSFEGYSENLGNYTKKTRH